MKRQKKIMQIKPVWLSLGVFVLCFSSGCATLIDGSTQLVTFKSLPEGVTVTVNGKTLGETPIVLDLERQSESVVEFYKEGYTKHSLQMETRMNGLVFVNLIWCFSCVLSTTTDYASGAAYQYDPNKYFVILVPEGVTETPSDTKKRKVKSFIMANHIGIVTELSKVSDEYTPDEYDEYLYSLIAMLEIPESDGPQAVYKIKTISSGAKDSLIFADEVIKAFMPSDH